MFRTWKFQLVFVVVLQFHGFGLGYSDVVLNEIYYNPVDYVPEPGSEREFVELYNPGAQAVDLSGYRFTQGIQYRFPVGAVCAADGYVVVAKNPGHACWKSATDPVYGPYEGRLDDSGERILLRRADGIPADEIRYDDEFPWPLGADGYKSSLERIGAYLPSEDWHSWRASLTPEGTPGQPNSVMGIPAYPSIVQIFLSNPNPRAMQAVDITVALDGSVSIHSVVLQYQQTIHYGGEGASSEEEGGLATMVPVGTDGDTTHYMATVPGFPSQSLIRFNIMVQLLDGQVLQLPHIGEPRPYASYFVYDGEIPSSIPLLWLFGAPLSHLSLGETIYYAAIVSEPGTPTVQVFDGIRLEVANNGRKIRFLKGEEYRGDRTLNLVSETPLSPTTSGKAAPIVEYMGFWFFRSLGVLAPRADWYRVIENPTLPEKHHAQCLAIQQVNERFIEMNGRDSKQDLYKWENDTYFVKHTNLEAGRTALRIFVESLQTTDQAKLKESIFRHMRVESFLRYSVISILISNWDGFFNNHWLYQNPPENETVPGKWEIIPWDLDKVWGFYGPGSQKYNLSPEYPLLGDSSSWSTQPGVVTGPFHQCEEMHALYVSLLRSALQRQFAEDSPLLAELKRMQVMLLEDAEKMEAYTGVKRKDLHDQIQYAVDRILWFIDQRSRYLDATLPATASEWKAYSG
ncbi:MAG: CotH kinase family protein [bacterium]|nr:CotH kinase family protein [bacterium]